MTSRSVEDVAKALSTPPWYQLYMPTTWDSTEKLVRRVKPPDLPCSSGPSTSLPAATPRPPRACASRTPDSAPLATSTVWAPTTSGPMFQGLPSDTAINPREPPPGATSSA